jgi:hypothetical protein
MRGSLIVAFLSACTFQGALEQPNGDAGHDTSDSLDAPLMPGWLSGFGFRKHITVNAGAGTLDDFPVSVALALDPDLATHARPDGSDLVFTGDDGTTVLGYEIAAFDPSGDLDAWVRMSLHAVSTGVYLYYGGATTTPLINAWAPTFMGVWHLASSTTAHDSSGHGNDATATPGKVPGPANGIIGAGRHFDGVDDTLRVGDPPDGSLDVGLTSFSYSAWVNVSQSHGPSDMPINKGGGTPTTKGYDMELGTGSWVTSIADGQRVASASFGTETLNEWIQLVAVVDRQASTLTAYFDGNQTMVTDISGFGSIDTTAQLTLGHQTFVFSGVLDEVEICRTALTPAWIAASYANAAVATRASFIAVGTEETP